jgi:3,4-dihydroxy 2-butanone 4-phosphate synthase/GTP cyclohydrolase II
MLFTSDLDDKEHMALIMGDVQDRENVIVRVHSECFTGDVLGSVRCDCGEQLERAMQMIAQAGRGVILYLRQEGRGIGLLDKLRAYNLQDEGLDTVEANIRLGHQPDERDYTVAALMLKDLRIRSVNLITNNPKKISELRGLGVLVQQRMPIEVPPRPENLHYLRTKAKRMDHLLQLGRSL